MIVRYMLDTDIASFIIRGTDKGLNRRVVAHAGHLFMSSITHHELLYGAQMRESSRLLETIAVLTELVPVAGFTSEAAEIAARIRATLDRTGRTIGVMDALIAGCAMAGSYTLITNNTAHFSRITDLKIENWLKG